MATHVLLCHQGPAMTSGNGEYAAALSVDEWVINPSLSRSPVQSEVVTAVAVSSSRPVCTVEVDVQHEDGDKEEHIRISTVKCQQRKRAQSSLRRAPSMVPKVLHSEERLTYKARGKRKVRLLIDMATSLSLNNGTPDNGMQAHGLWLRPTVQVQHVIVMSSNSCEHAYCKIPCISRLQSQQHRIIPAIQIGLVTVGHAQTDDSWSGGAGSSLQFNPHSSANDNSQPLREVPVDVEIDLEIEMVVHSPIGDHVIVGGQADDQTGYDSGGDDYIRKSVPALGIPQTKFNFEALGLQ
ncbi:uncharacterized protein EV420DRAFT_1483396 [Desarmillaria tabescens]|uniref:Uncharacterized protein n=1 Tax=Armillaria tabescens TaxID=1929756 RepID=A0AA39JU71_ARMTA|nr:uncharacterized protein EV420DRAFT_1483396 [Desarmillaria tabescens]KAK0448987.1 hypothetical protein EV420DRAFT_1483396 [Desarmillaria tabescens]